jgi:DNA repair exonuclease SbcCD ATPase subunit
MAKEIIFKSISIKNFLSIGNQPLEINFTKGITVITGENKDKGGKNGIGKSTIADSIFWCLFGNTIRDLKKDKIQHNQNDEECRVVLSFEVKEPKVSKNYQITRVLNPSKIEILCNGGDITLSTLPKNDEFIKLLINANEEVFNNAVIMSANNTIPFMAQKKTEKRKFIEGILQLSVFSDMLLKARSRYNDIKKENDIECNNFINLQKNLEVFENQFKEETERKKKSLENWKYTIEINLQKIEELKNEKFPNIQIVEDQINKLETEKLVVLKQILKTTNTSASENNSKKYILITEIKNVKKEKQKILDKGNVCPTCNREYCKDDVEVINNKIVELDESIKNYESQLDEVNEKFTGIQNKIQTIEDGIDKVEIKIKELNILKKNINSIQNKIHELENHNNIGKCQIADLQKQKSISNANVDSYKKQIEEKEIKLKEIKKELSILDSVKYILSEEGVKTYIVKKIITVLNNRLNFYLNLLEAPCKCIFDEMFEETIYNEKGKDVSYFNFSGGERKRIDTAILFTFQDILRFHSGTSFSLNIYDELLDCALDARGTDKIMEILKDKVDRYNESIYIVSHKHSEVSNIDNVIFLEKNNGVTSIRP